MGCGASKITETPPNFPYFCLTFHWVDIFRLIHATPRTSNLMRKCLETYWPRGITDHALYYGAIDFEMGGRPFVKGTNLAETIKAKIAICHMLEYFLADGWRLLVSADMCRIIDGTSWIFERREKQASPGRPATICTISLSNTDQIQLLHATDDLYAEMKTALKQHYPKPLQGEQEIGDGNFALKLKGNPWSSEGAEGMGARKFLLEAIRRFENAGYYIYGTANIKRTADSIFFTHHPDGNGRLASLHEYAMISLNENDRIRLIDFPERINQVVREVIYKFRGRDMIQRAEEYHGSFEFKLKGNPWCAEAQDVVYSRLLVSKMLEALRSEGWVVQTTIDVSSKMNDKAVFVFRSDRPENLAHFCVAPSEVDKIRVIAAPAEVLVAIRDTLTAYWPIGIEKEDANFYGGHEFKLRGQPWFGRHGTHELHSRSFFCFLLQRLASMGWTPVAACDVSAKHVRTENGPDYPVDTHSWFFAKTNK